MNQPCDSYCEHGGVCIREKGHVGLHDSRYCQWDDEHGLTKEAADAILIAKNPTIGPFIAVMESVAREGLSNV